MFTETKSASHGDESNQETTTDTYTAQEQYYKNTFLVWSGKPINIGILFGCLRKAPFSTDIF